MSTLTPQRFSKLYLQQFLTPCHLNTVIYVITIHCVNYYLLTADTSSSSNHTCCIYFQFNLSVQTYGKITSKINKYVSPGI